MSRPLGRLGVARLGGLAFVVWLGSAHVANAVVAYVALRDGRWQVYFQKELSSKPERANVDFAGDGGSPSLDGEGAKLGPAAGTGPAGPLPDGSLRAAKSESLLAFETSGGRVLVCPLAGKTKCDVIEEPGAQLARPAWLRGEKQPLLVRFKASGATEDSDLFQAVSGKLVPLLTQTGVQDDPDVSGDGRWLVYSSAQIVALRQAGVQVVQHIWVADLTTGHAAPLIPGDARDTQPDWAPSGDVIAFASNRTGEFEIWAVRRDGSDLKQITSAPGSKTSPTWSPDGKRIMFTMIRDGRYSLWIIDQDGSDLHPFQPFGSTADIQLRDADWR